ncbi:LANO_0H04610g1_1 [Lachancea nothofagi CBS 11611]|uniref:LANO_0H04610g1_1 n=1 Tax=Lachancea nothofagi CBS 11611 TaxID=1266666 RepID=A0A1G4KL79_9SACH|nr:LANO_0H04610g1_1 [Lachancea nothofagi CBS 11611]
MNKPERIEFVDWPDETRIARQAKKYQSFIFVQSLFYNAGIVVSLWYVIAALALQPLLQSQSDQRLQLNADCLLRIRGLINGLESRLKTTSVSALGYNERANSITGKSSTDRCTQTEETTSGNSLGDNSPGWSRVTARLKSACEALNTFNEPECSDDNDTPKDRYLPLKFQVQSLHSCLLGLEVRNYDPEEMARKSVQAIREMKGWIINGSTK